MHSFNCLLRIQCWLTIEMPNQCVCLCSHWSWRLIGICKQWFGSNLVMSQSNKHNCTSKENIHLCSFSSLHGSAPLVSSITGWRSKLSACFLLNNHYNNHLYWLTHFRWSGGIKETTVLSRFCASPEKGIKTLETKYFCTMLQAHCLSTYWWIKLHICLVLTGQRHYRKQALQTVHNSECYVKEFCRELTMNRSSNRLASSSPGWLWLTAQFTQGWSLRTV